MKDLIKIAEEQIEILEDMQKDSCYDVVFASVEIRKWCEFIKSLDKKKTAREE